LNSSTKILIKKGLNVLTEKSRYAELGIRPQEEALGALLKHLPTSIKAYPSNVTGGYFANVLDLGNNTGVAFCTDGVGTKMLVAEMMGKYDTIGIDCVAMNVNDLICVGARPVSMVDYIACSELDTKVFDALGKGLGEGARKAGISISGGEVAQLKEVINGIDLIGSCIGHVKIDQINTGQTVKPGNLILGLSSSGIHANGLTYARNVLLGDSPERQKDNINKFENSLGRTIGAELLEPTQIYVKPVMEMIDSGIDLKAMIHITSGSYENLNRVNCENVSFVIDSLPDPLPIFELIQEEGEISNEEMFEVFNMGIGFCVIVDSANDADAVHNICKKYDISCHGIGYVEASSGKEVKIPEKNLILKNQKGLVK